MNSTTKTFQYGEHQVSLTTGGIARQADGAVLVNMAETIVLVTAVGRKQADPGRDFFPLTVNYQEKTYAAGKIPGGFFKREGRPAEKETLVCRLIDRPIRPLFPKGFKNEVQVIATVMSLNPEVDADIPALIGASAALAISGMPFAGPIGAAKVSYIDGNYVLNPSVSAARESDLELVVAGTKDAVLMVESEANSLSEEIMLGAVMFGHEQMQIAISTINELAAEVGKPAWDWVAPAEDEELAAAVATQAQGGMTAAYMITDKQERQAAVADVKAAAVAELASDGDDARWSAGDVMSATYELEKNTVRQRIIAGEPRIDGRDKSTVRPINIDVGLLPRAHGSAVFTRGETQAIVAVTLGTGRDAQIVDAITGEYKDNFMLHYNFPPFCVGETGFVGSPKRREIGHGKLARRSIEAVLPSQDDFGYVIRVVSEITESNGSSSMASVCGTSLALMDAGVPMKGMVAGISIGLVTEAGDNGSASSGKRYELLTDIIGSEDHYGDMDFKLCGTDAGVTGFQLEVLPSMFNIKCLAFYSVQVGFIVAVLQFNGEAVGKFMPNT
ncbi:MAG: polyribonucleotide nucleotidyltransferase [Proteobacteria bacterium]|nr:polyribonucleotide nucleotidyltransferase [Pseudomonadota bacterium]